MRFFFDLSLLAKTAVIMSGLMAIFVAMQIFSVYKTTWIHQQAVQQSLNHDLARSLSVNPWLAEKEHWAAGAIGNVFSRLMAINPSIEIYLLDDNGHIIDYSAPEEKIVRKKLNLEPIEEFISGDVEFPVFGDDPRSQSTQKIFSAAQVTLNDDSQGYLYAVIGGEQYDMIESSFRKSYLDIVIWKLLSGFIILLGVSCAILFYALPLRLRRLIDIIESYRGSKFLYMPEFGTWRPRRTGDEIDQLATTFQEMAQHLQDQFSTINQAKQAREEWIEELAHDLKNPLVSLRVNLERLKQSKGLEQEESCRRRLDGSLDFVNQMDKLITELGELAILDSPTPPVKSQYFPLNEMIFEIGNKYRERALNKGIVLSMHVAANPVFIFGDIGLIERAFNNILDNAIKYTSSGGEVELTLKEVDAAVIVEVADTGVGIGVSNQRKIFQRYYRISGGNETGGGLGLAICKRIFDLHKARIEIESQPRVGTRVQITFQRSLVGFSDEFESVSG